MPTLLLTPALPLESSIYFFLNPPSINDNFFLLLYSFSDQNLEYLSLTLFFLSLPHILGLHLLSTYTPISFQAPSSLFNCSPCFFALVLATTLYIYHHTLGNLFFSTDPCKIRLDHITCELQTLEWFSISLKQKHIVLVLIFKVFYPPVSSPFPSLIFLTLPHFCSPRRHTLPQGPGSR